jgi:hypothetical protein
MGTLSNGVATRIAEIVWRGQYFGASERERPPPINTPEISTPDPALARLPDLLPQLEALYTDVHAHPEIRTAGLAAEGCARPVMT